ncbi:MAG TPA: Rieske 2Fe-2S domain-containing protein [Dehalococcoidia bacterium]|nr:Rieske 2Fe-2S domain-containing protein [Dehalococcoidia bacterium]
MLSVADNELLTRTGPGTPMGELFRRFWLPALLPSELPSPDCAPIRLRLLGEDLIAFRDTSGRVGFVANACPHRGASLFFGRNEEDGLRCVYHGWKFDVTGACVDMPSEPAESNFKSKVRVRAYPSAEAGGLVWIYMGPPEKQPDLPRYEWMLQPGAENSRVSKHMQDSNYTQGLEGNIDSAHVTFLHRVFGAETFLRGIPYAPPQITQSRETEFGFVYGARREAPDDQYYWRVTAFVYPTFTHIASTSRSGGGIFVLPMDDEHSWWFMVQPTAPAGQEERTARAVNSQNGPFAYVSQFDQSTLGLIPGTFRYIRNAGNDYMIDRDKQRTLNYTGLPGNRTQDAAVTESMGPIYDRSKEHLGTTDVAVIHMRRELIKMAQQLQQGIEPAILTDPARFRAVPMDVVTNKEDLSHLWDPFWSEVKVERGIEAPAAV